MELIGDLVKRNRIQPDHAPFVIVGGLDFWVVVRICEMMQREMPVPQRVSVVGIALVHVLRRNRGPHREQRREDDQCEHATWRPRHSVIMSAGAWLVNLALHALSHSAAPTSTWPTPSPAAKTQP
jgi:hypothetical protein